MKSINISVRLVVAIALLLTFITPGFAQQPRPGVIALADDSPSDSWTFPLLHSTITVWADGKGDQILEQRIKNTDYSSLSSITWWYDWPSGAYSNIRAWDDEGPLSFSTTSSGTRVDLTIYFRYPVAPGAVYHFSQAITIGGVATSTGGDTWHAHWYTQPGTEVQDFLQGMTFPSNAVITGVSPEPTSRHNNYLEWVATNTPPYWGGITTDVYYTLSSAINVSLLRQTDTPWEDDPYGRYPGNDTVNTIRRWGCFMTSAAMIINYWGARSQPTFSTDPGVFNSWLRSNIAILNGL